MSAWQSRWLRDPQRGFGTLTGSKRWSGQKRVPVQVDPAIIAAAEHQAKVCTAKLSELARGHPSTKVWRARFAKAQKVLEQAL